MNNVNRLKQKWRSVFLTCLKTKSLIFIEKKFETLEGIIVDLYSVRSQEELKNSFLNCENLVKINDKQNIIHKEYKLVELNFSL